MKTEELAQKIVELVGGEENIESVTYCMTRLRFTLKDIAEAQTEKLDAIPEVIKIINFGGQYQIVLGNIVEEVYKSVIKIGNISSRVTSKTENVNNESHSSNEKEQNIIERLIGVLSGIFIPIIPAMLGMGFIKVITVLMDVFFKISDDNSTYVILDTLGDSLFYFLPVLVGWSAARKFNANTGIALMIMGLLIHPEFIELLSENQNVNFLGIPVVNVEYANSVLPAILSVYLLSKVEILLKNILPKMIRTIAVPFLSLLIVGPITILLLGPIGYWGGTAITTVFTSLHDFSPLLAGALIGGIWQLLIIVGMHIAILSLVTIPNIALMGRDPIIVASEPSLICQMAAGLAVSLREKNPTQKKTVSSLTFASFFAGSIVEPVMYGVNLRYKRPFYFVMLGGAIGGAIAGASNAGKTAPVALSLYSLPSFFGEGFTGLMIGTLVGSLITFILTFFFGVKESKKTEEESEAGSQSTNII